MLPTNLKNCKWQIINLLSLSRCYTHKILCKKIMRFLSVRSLLTFSLRFSYQSLLNSSSTTICLSASSFTDRILVLMDTHELSEASHKINYFQRDLFRKYRLKSFRRMVSILSARTIIFIVILWIFLLVQTRSIIQPFWNSFFCAQQSKSRFSIELFETLSTWQCGIELDLLSMKTIPIETILRWRWTRSWECAITSPLSSDGYTRIST
jgi:hypothetical protein